MSRVFFCRRIRFRAAHHYALEGLDTKENQALFGEAAFPHEHHWQLTLWLEGPVDPQTGMIEDLTYLDRVLREEVLERFHGKHINRVDAFFQKNQPTTEVLATYFAEMLAPYFRGVTLAKLQIAESEDIFAEWLP